MFGPFPAHNQMLDLFKLNCVMPRAAEMLAEPRFDNPRRGVQHRSPGRLRPKVFQITGDHGRSRCDSVAIPGPPDQPPLLGWGGIPAILLMFLLCFLDLARDQGLVERIT